MHTPSWLSWSAALLCALPFLSSLSAGQQPVDEPHTLGSVAGITTLPNGIRIVTSSGGVEQIVALRDDVLRVRAAANRDLPEDASWAVSPETRKSTVDVTREDTVESVGFRTGSLHVSVQRNDMRRTVRDQQERLCSKMRPHCILRALHFA